MKKLPNWIFYSEIMKLSCYVFFWIKSQWQSCLWIYLADKWKHYIWSQCMVTHFNMIAWLTHTLYFKQLCVQMGCIDLHMRNTVGIRLVIAKYFCKNGAIFKVKMLVKCYSTKRFFKQLLLTIKCRSYQCLQNIFGFYIACKGDNCHSCASRFINIWLLSMRTLLAFPGASN